MNTTRTIARCTVLTAVFALAAAVPAATPAQNQRFVAKVYQDLLARTPNRNEFSLATFMLSWGVTRTQIAGGITASNEYRADQIQLWFAAFLNRPAAAGELAFYLNLLQNGAANDDVKSAILGSDEYYHLAGGSASGFINRLFHDVLSRPADRSSVAAFETLLGQGTPRQTVASLVLHSLEADQRTINQWFARFLNRAPSAAELASYSQMLQMGAKEEVVIDLIVGSEEYLT